MNIGKRKCLILIIALTLLSLLPSMAQFPMPKEGWVAVPGASADGYGVYVFRRDINLDAVSGKWRVWVTGDNRYKLMVNGQTVSVGPARSDLDHWNCEEVDLASYLHAGKNVVAALVWNEGPQRPAANMTYRTGFYLHAIDDAAKVLNTDKNWKCTEDKSYSPTTVSVPGYYAAGPGEKVDMHSHISDWYKADADASAWQQAQVISPANKVGQSGNFGTYMGWMLKKSELPQRELTLQRIPGFAPATVPANSTKRIILDNRELTNAYFTLKFSGGDKSRIKVGYCEAFYEKDGTTKNDRRVTAGKQFIGRSDEIISNGAQGQDFTTLAWRTYRYVVLDITTDAESLTLDDAYGTFTGFPFELTAHLDTKDNTLLQIFNIGWRTARLCAIETYMDCPYYEQLQYFGDARIQALVSLYMAGETRLVRQLLDMGDWSRRSDGVIQSRYPSGLAQWIQPYALHYIYTMHDYMMYADDLEFLKSKLNVERTILDYFQRYQTADGRVKDLPGWNFTDWVNGDPNWQAGVALPGADGANSIMDMQLLYAYEMAADMEAKVGMKALADVYNERAAQLKNTIVKKYWRDDKGLFSDRSDKDVFSQHANALAILTGLITGDTAKNIAGIIESDNSLSKASIYFKFYTHQAMVKAGLGDNYLNWLGKWRENIDMGMTTWGETSEVATTRSDCHAWGASPNIEFFRTVLGIDSDAPGFGHVAIAPHLGTLKSIGGTMPSPKGNIAVEYKKAGNGINAKITLPQGLTGTFCWHGQSKSLASGENTIQLK